MTLNHYNNGPLVSAVQDRLHANPDKAFMCASLVTNFEQASWLVLQFELLPEGMRSAGAGEPVPPGFGVLEFQHHAFGRRTPACKDAGG